FCPRQRAVAARSVVKNEERGCVRERAREYHALLLPSGQRAERPPREVRGIDARERVARDGTFIGAGIAAASQAMQARHEDDVLDDERIVPVKLLSLRQIRDAMVSAGWLAEHRRAPAHRPQD